DAALTQIAEWFYATQTAFPLTATAQAESRQQTAVALVPPTPEEIIAPTLDATPDFATLAPDEVIEGTLPPDDDTPEERIGDPNLPGFEPTGTPPPTATFIFPTVPPVAVPPPTVPANWQQQVEVAQRAFTSPDSTQSFTIGAIVPIGQGAIRFAGGDALPRIFARNPANPDQYVQTSENGVLTINTGAGDQIPAKPFSPFVAQVSAPEQNDYFVTAVAWSPNGRYVAFVVDGGRGGHPDPTGEDGVHLLDTQTGDSRALVRDCPREGHPGCILGGGRDFEAHSVDLHWSPDGTRLIVRQHIPDSGRGALLITPLDQSSERQPPTLRFDYGAWTNDGGRIVVSGRSAAHGVIIGTVAPDGDDLRVVLDGSSRGLWLQDAVQRPDGSFVALGRPAAESAVRIIDGNGNFLTPPIGDGAPQSVTWNAERSAVTVIVDGRGYVAYTDGRVVADSAGGDGATIPPFALPTPPDDESAPLLPRGVVEGSAFQTGQQVQINSEILNIRNAPGLEAPFAREVLRRGEYARILAGPVRFDGYDWWLVNTGDARQGWIAGEIGGVPTFNAIP
ncbi:MAG: hypothetical protein EA396_00350, partial [Anaerolineaceae bacterium]